MKILLNVFIFLFFILIQTETYSQSSDEAYEYLQNQRQVAGRLYENIKNPPIDSLTKAEKILEDALTYYFNPKIVELAKTNKPLFARETDINFDLAFVKVYLNKIIEAEKLFEKNFKTEFGSTYYDWLLQNPVFDKLKNSNYLKQYFRQFDAERKIFNGQSLNTPYKFNISESEKLAGLSKFWSEAKYNFAYFENLPDLDWDKTYLEFIPKIQKTKNTLEYLKLMQEFCAMLKDGHTNIWASSDSLNNLTNFKPPIRTQLVENKVLITKVLQDSLAKTGLKPGQEIISIDKVPVLEYAEKFVKPYQSASTDQDLLMRTFSYNLLKGPKNQSLTLKIKDIDGKIFTRILPRKGYSKVMFTPSYEFKILPGNIAYFAINEFESSKASQKFKALFDSISKTNALILDIRRNGGGDTDFSILSYLTDKPIPYAQNLVRKYVPYYRAQGEGIIWEKLSESSYPPNKTNYFNKPVILLTSAQTFSAAEDFAVGFKSLKNGKIIGEPTGGSTGQPLAFSLPGGLMARVCTKKDLFPNGTKFVGVGIQPDISIKPSIMDIRAEKDTVLIGALEYLKNNNN